MKKFLALLCMITCIFGLTACGSGDKLSVYEQQKLDYAQQLSTEMLVPILAQFTQEDIDAFNDYTAEEVEYVLGNQSNLNVDGNGLRNAIASFLSAKEKIGGIVDITGSRASISGNTIVVEVDIKGEKKDATAEVILSNDMFMKLESASLNPASSLGGLMANAGLNTLIGMGTVFAVLILISFIISGFRIIPKIQESVAKKKAPKEEATGIDNAVTQIVEQEAIEEEADDLELVAVIAAAIAASEGAVTTDGFVVRSIRRRR